MKTKIIEVTDGSYYGKFMLGRFDRMEWSRRCEIKDDQYPNMALLNREGWTDQHLMILDMSSTGVAGVFLPHSRGDAAGDTVRKGISQIV